MKIKSSVLITAILAAGVAFSSVFAQYGGGQQQSSSQPGTGQTAAKPGGKKPGEVLTGGAIVATPITEDEAKKKYPMPGGKAYPMGDRDIHQPSGWIYSPYDHQLFDCSAIPYGGLVLDTRVNKVFVRPKTK